MRTPPNIMRRDLAGLPTQAIGILFRRLPVRVVDKVAGATQRLTVGELSRYGMPRPERGLYTRVRDDDRIPILDVGLIRAIKRGEIEIVPAWKASTRQRSSSSVANASHLEQSS